MGALKLIALLFTLASLCLCDDAQQEPRRYFNQVPVYTQHNHLVPNQGQDIKSNIGYNYNNNYENLYKQDYAGNYGNEYANGYRNEYANGYGNDYNTAQNTKVNYGQYGNGYMSDYAGQYGQLYGNNYGNDLKSNLNSELVGGYTTAYGTGGSDSTTNTKTVSTHIPTGSYYGYNYGELLKSIGSENNVENVKSPPTQVPTRYSYGPNYGETSNIKVLPIQVPGQDYHEYSYEEALKASGALDASGNIIANTKSAPVEVATGNQYGYNYEKELKSNAGLDQSGNIVGNSKELPAHANTASYYGYNYGGNVNTALNGYKASQQNVYVNQLSAEQKRNPKNEMANDNGHLYNNIANAAFNKETVNQVPQQNYYTGRIGKQLNTENKISNAYESGYGYGNSNAEFANKPIATDVYQTDNSKNYIGLYQAAQAEQANGFAAKSAINDYKTQLATALVYHTNSQGDKYNFGQKYPTSVVNNAFGSGYENLNSYQVPKSAPVQVSKPQNYEYKSIEASIPNLNEFTQSEGKAYYENYPISNTESTAEVQIPQSYIAAAKPYQVNAQYTASEAQTISGLDSHAYLDSTLQSLPTGKQQPIVYSSYVKDHKAALGLQQEIHSYQEPKFVSVGPYQYAVHPVEVSINGQSIAGNVNVDNKNGNTHGPVTFTNNGFESTVYNYDGHGTGVYKNSDVHTGYGKEVTGALHHDLNEVNSTYAGFHPSEYASTGSVSNGYQSQHGTYNTVNYNPNENTVEDYLLNGHNVTGENSNLYGYNGYESYSNEHPTKASEPLSAGFETENYKSNVYNHQPSAYSSANYVSSGYVVGGTNGYHSGDQTSSNIQTTKYEPSTYKTITNGSNNYDLGYHSKPTNYESGYESDEHSIDTYGSNGFKPIELTTSSYKTSIRDASGYKFSAQEPQDFVAYNQLSQDPKKNNLESTDYKSDHYSYSAAKTKAEKILAAEIGTGHSESTNTKLNDQIRKEEKSKSDDKSQTKKGKSGSSSAYVSVSHGNHSYSYNVKHNTK